ncbi:A/G-specific adenine glycosylase [bacterium]|nr:A/G-specific adenine glycosylase [candidate division CSSED10-310 bacterium]
MEPLQVLEELRLEVQKSGIDEGVLKQFRTIVFTWYRENGRRFPWREHMDPYAVLVSELMLQQTQAHRVAPKYDAFLARFPTFEALAAASLEEVLSTWRGLGYNRRALSLKRIAHVVVHQYGGRLPDDPGELIKLAGIGPATAASICAFAFNKPVVFLETNIRAVLIHVFCNDRAVVADTELMELAGRVFPGHSARDWYNALMDLGSALKKLLPNPSRRSAGHRRQEPFRGSRREIRGTVLRLLLAAERDLRQTELAVRAAVTPAVLASVVEDLAREGFLVIEKDAVRLAGRTVG